MVTFMLMIFRLIRWRFDVYIRADDIHVDDIHADNLPIFSFDSIDDTHADNLPIFSFDGVDSFSKLCLNCCFDSFRGLL
jgi:hypothetical protein